MYSNFKQCNESLSDCQPIDFFLAKKLQSSLIFSTDSNLSSGEAAIAFHLFMALSSALNDGHTCLLLSTVAEQRLWDQDVVIDGKTHTRVGFEFPPLAIFVSILNKLPITVNDGNPLTFEHNRLYLSRYWAFETEVAQALLPRLQEHSVIDLESARDVLSRLFPKAKPSESSAKRLDMQKVAVANSLNKNFAVIAGGPGTGKTTTVTKLLLALLMIHQRSNSHQQLNEQSLSNQSMNKPPLSDRALNIKMAAPTGKAAQRLMESITGSLKRVAQECHLSDEIIDAIPNEASTIHRLLGVKRHEHNFKHDAENPLDLDVLLVDEISMVDLPLMARLLRAMPVHGRLIVLGDADQLPSVAAGSVLADIAPRELLGYSPPNIAMLNKLTGYAFEPSGIGLDHLSLLTFSYRFDGSGGIGLLAKAVIAGDVDETKAVLASNNHQLTYHEHSSLIEWLSPQVKQHYSQVFSVKNISEAFTAFDNFRVLCANRKGERGTENINQLTENLLRKFGTIKTRDNLYHGKPIMITTNEYSLGLYNGDIGLIWQVNNKLLAIFPDGKDENNEVVYRYISPARLPTFETVYAMTIHKTQGSEFANVALVLPEEDNPILSRELFYTGITRSKTHINLLADKTIVAKTTEKRIIRHSALKLRLFE
ncbi:MAG: exodeoxyribonuclease V subunit alpha [Thalassotalea sp.]|nr:exodeoxyribonuclease V subunit alpha [Thalassotalea sp.]